MNELTTQLEQFHRDGFLVVPDALAPDMVARVLRGVEKAFEVAPSAEVTEHYAGIAKIWRPKMFECGEEFEELVDNPGIIDLVEAILGPDCHLIANSALRTTPGQAIDFWHVDETVRFPRPDGVPLDERIPMPCFIVNLNYYLCDVDLELGPTQFVPGSHRAGRQPEAKDFDEAGSPSYEGQGVFSAVGRAGTAVLWNDQTWHRGGSNVSDGRVRWVQQAPYGRRFIAQRFFPFVNYHLPEEILERANPRRQRLLGKHAPGPFG